MKRVLKFALNQPSEHVFGIDLPIGAEFMTAAYQGEMPQAWFLCPMDAKSDPRIFLIVGTGWEIHNKGEWKYLQTLFQGPYVWHLFELLEL